MKGRYKNARMEQAMKYLKLQIHRFSIVQVSVILLIFGVILGVLFANLFQGAFLEQIQKYQNTIYSDIAKKQIDYSGLFTYIVGKNFKEFFIFWLISVTILGIPYMAYKITSYGFFTGFFISVITMQYGLKGILLVLVYAFPHGLLYLPVALLCLYKGYTMCKTIYNEKRYNLHGIIKMLQSQFLLLLVLALIILIGSFLEAYAGAFLLKKTLRLFY